MAKPRLLDLFSGAGGASAGYSRAGFDVTGVDIAPQPNYPFEFHQADALDYLAEYGEDYDFIHASPPCQRHSTLKRLHNTPAYAEKHTDWIDRTRALIETFDVPYVIENVVGAPLRNPILLCGAQFGLHVYRHRLFESSMLLMQPPHYPHADKTPSLGRGVSPKGFISVGGTGGVVSSGLPAGRTANEYMAEAMGIDWMTRRELSQAIPPAFTQYIGTQMMWAAFAEWMDLPEMALS